MSGRGLGIKKKKNYKKSRHAAPGCRWNHTSISDLFSYYSAINFFERSTIALLFFIPPTRCRVFLFRSLWAPLFECVFLVVMRAFSPAHQARARFGTPCRRLCGTAGLTLARHHRLGLRPCPIPIFPSSCSPPTVSSCLLLHSRRLLARAFARPSHQGWPRAGHRCGAQGEIWGERGLWAGRRWGSSTSMSSSRRVLSGTGDTITRDRGQHAHSG